MNKLLFLEEAKKDYAEYFQQNTHKCIKYTTPDKWIFEEGKVAEHVGIMVKGAARRFYIEDMDTYESDRGISYNFYYKDIRDTSDDLGDPLIPPASLIFNEPELFYVELIKTKIVSEPLALLMPIDVFRQDMQTNAKLKEAVDILITNKLVELADRYKKERASKHNKQKHIEYIAQLYDENHHVFANQVLNIHACTYFDYNKYSYSARIKEVHKYRRERR